MTYAIAGVVLTAWLALVAFFASKTKRGREHGPRWRDRESNWKRRIDRWK